MFTLFFRGAFSAQILPATPQTKINAATMIKTLIFNFRLSPPCSADYYTPSAQKVQLVIEFFPRE